MAQQLGGALLLGIGLLFDLLSLIALLSTLRGRFSSGFPLVGALFYLMFAAGAALGLLRLGSVSDPYLLVAGLVVAHVLIQVVHVRVSRSRFPLPDVPGAPQADAPPHKARPGADA